jgi:hypothetical protein
MTTVETPRRIDLRIDCTETGSLLRGFAVLLGFGALAQ